MSHTPGPWYVGHEKRGTVYNPSHIFADKDGDKGVASVSGIYLHRTLNQIIDDPQCAEGLANARLIAAAPEMLEALKGLLADIEDYQRINHLGGENNATQVAARAAIAKAEGREAGK